MHDELEQDEDLDPEDDFYQEPDFRSQDAIVFHLPRSAQGPTYFRYSGMADNGTTHGVALFLDYGINICGVDPAFARIAIVVEGRSEMVSMGGEDLNQLAGTLLDEADRRRKLDVTIEPGAPAAAVVPYRMPITMPVEQLERLVGALLDGADALEIYRRTGLMRPRNPDS